jgi:hypothetical protein
VLYTNFIKEKTHTYTNKQTQLAYFAMSTKKICYKWLHQVEGTT